MDGVNVQVYLEHHKINQLFEEMMSRIVSEQPPEPISFLISILRSRRSSKKPTGKDIPPLPSSSPSLSRDKGRLQIRGTTVEARQTSSKMSKSSDNLRPSSSPMPAPHKPLTSTGSPKLRSSTAQGVRPQSRSPAPPSSRTSRSPAPPRGSKPLQTVSSKPVATSSKGAVKAALSKPHSSPRLRSSKDHSSLKKSSDVKSSKENKGTRRGHLSIKHCSLSLPEGKGLIPTSQSSNLVDELFGEKECPKVGVSEDEESEDELDPSAGQSVSEDAAMAALRQHRESKQVPCKHTVKMVSVREVETVGYITPEEDDDSSDDSHQEFYECPALLQDEGVSVVSRRKSKYRLPSIQDNGRDPLITFTICTQCSRILPPQESTTTASSTLPGSDDIDSVSQVGSHVSFPQWDSVNGDGHRPSILQQWTDPPSLSADNSSVFTSSSLDTWAGLAPPRKSNRLSSDLESESTLVGGPWTLGSKDNSLARRWANQS